MQVGLTDNTDSNVEGAKGGRAQRDQKPPAWGKRRASYKLPERPMVPPPSPEPFDEAARMDEAKQTLQAMANQVPQAQVPIEPRCNDCNRRRSMTMNGELHMTRLPSGQVRNLCVWCICIRRVLHRATQARLAATQAACPHEHTEVRTSDDGMRLYTICAACGHITRRDKLGETVEATDDEAATAWQRTAAAE
jgi:hypothetical protein